MRRLAKVLRAPPVRALGVAAGYYFSALIGTIVSVPPLGFAIVWPATAFLIGVFLLTPSTAWWRYAAMVVAAHFFLASSFDAAPFSVILTQIAGNLGLAAATAGAVRLMFPDTMRFDSFGAMASFALIAGVVIPAIGNIVILAIHMMNGAKGDFWLSWRQWMLASVFPTLTIPPLMLLAERRRTSRRGLSDLDRERVVLFLVLFLVGYVAFGWEVEPGWRSGLLLAPVPFFILAAMRGGVSGVCLALLAFAGAVIARAIGQRGPFAVGSSIDSVLEIQTFLTLSAAPFLLLAALMQERRRAEELLRRSEARMEVIASSTDTGLWQWDRAAGDFWMTTCCRALLGVAAEPNPRALLAQVNAEDRKRLYEALRSMLVRRDVIQPEPFRFERNGQQRWLALSACTEFSEKGRPARISGVVRDVTVSVLAQRRAQDLAGKLTRLQDEERRRIALEIHDSTAQHLVAANLGLSALRRRTNLSAEAASLMTDVVNCVSAATRELRTFSYLLSPAMGEDLSTEVRRYVDGFVLRTGIVTTLRSSVVADQLSRASQKALLRVVQEALMNVHRHAGARNASVSMRVARGNLHVVIGDDGMSMPFREKRAWPTLGVGVPGMIERVNQLGGQIEFRSRTCGTTVHIALPVHRAYVDAKPEPALMLE